MKLKRKLSCNRRELLFVCIMENRVRKEAYLFQIIIGITNVMMYCLFHKNVMNTLSSTNYKEVDCGIRTHGQMT